MLKEQIQRYLRYFILLARHMEWTRLVNFLKIEWRFFCNNPRLFPLHPYVLIVDLSNACNLQCPLCQTGLRQSVSRQNLMNLQMFKSIVTPLQPYLFQIMLYNWGEPFLNRDIYRILRFIHECNIASIVSSNFNRPIDAAAVCDSGLDHLVISADGVTQDVYERYRKGGSINLVMENLDALVAEKLKRNTKYPYIEWQCLVHRYNEKQLGLIKKTALKHGVNSVRFANMNFFSVADNSNMQQEWQPKNPRFQFFSKKKEIPPLASPARKPCFWLWRAGVVTVDGGLIPCCLYDVPNWGSLLQDSFSTAWNNQLFTQARNRSQNEKSLKTHSLVCDQCTAEFIYR